MGIVYAHAALERILGQIVMPKLLAAVNSWDPHTDSIPMHIWVHPWLPLLGDQKHSILYDTVRTKLESVLNAWHPSDVSAYTILSPWMPVFDRETWEQIMVRYISPKLLAVMHEFQVNPADQKLDQFYWVRKWVNVIPIHHMLHIMTVFFNKWLQVLYHWLCSQPIIREVSNWVLSYLLLLHMSKSQIEQQQQEATLTWKHIPQLQPHHNLFQCRSRGNNGFASVSMLEFEPTALQLLKHLLSIVALVPKDAAVFVAGTLSGAAAKTVTAPLDRIKLIMQTHGLRVGQESAMKAIGFVQVSFSVYLSPFVSVGKQEGLKGYWKGSFAQVVRVLPYSAVQLFAYDTYKATYPLDVLRLHLAVDPGYQTMTDVRLKMLKEEGLGSFYRGLGPSLIGISPYDKKSLTEKYRNRPEASILTAFVAASIATLTCYPLDTVRRQIQMRGTPYKSILDAFSAIVACDGVAGLYRGFVPNALKTLPNSSIKVTTFDAMKCLILASEIEFQRTLEENRTQQMQGANASAF
ncbi:probable envelope ADP,ATP carrier protein, chloroplastic [Tanacetum coccineum]